MIRSDAIRVLRRAIEGETFTDETLREASLIALLPGLDELEADPPTTIPVRTNPLPPAPDGSHWGRPAPGWVDLKKEKA